MDKNTITGFVLIAAVLFGFSWFSRPSEEEIRAQHQQGRLLGLLGNAVLWSQGDSHPLGNTIKKEGCGIAVIVIVFVIVDLWHVPGQRRPRREAVPATAGGAAQSGTVSAAC